ALPVPEMTASSDRDTAPTVTVRLPENTTTFKVDIPVENVTAGTVAILVHEDGSEEVLKNTVQTESGISVAVSDGDTLKIVDNSKTFDDVANDYWGAAAIDFATSRELFAGTAENTFSPDSDMTRAMIWSVLARYEGADTTAAEGSAWYAGSQQWAIDNGISDGTNPNDPMTREQFAAMLYRSAGSPAVSGSVGDFSDAASISSWASDAMIWAVQNGIIGGYEDSTLRPQNTATRTEVAAMLQRYVILNAQ
ncbi:MAG: S-layer homology domain-containing protein, partial [Peptococcaceae bacterium]|nr:S-layer homology domain-containing protein [Peptococcaceae bacterium]